MAFGEWTGRLAGVGTAILLGLSTVSAAAPPSAVEGVWLTDRATQLTIASCGHGYCGYISKVVVPEDIRRKMGGQLAGIDPASYLDVNNENPRLRNRPIQGLQILTLRNTGNPNYYEGEIYNPEDGKTYSGSVEVLGANSIRLKGCVLYVLCQEQQWQRISR